MEANLSHATGMLGASLTEARSGKALSDRPALEPYRGKPDVRNLRGDDGSVRMTGKGDDHVIGNLS